MFAMETCTLRYTISFWSAGELCSENQDYIISRFFPDLFQVWFLCISDWFNEDCSNHADCVKDEYSYLQNLIFLWILFSFWIPDFSVKEKTETHF